KIEDVAFITGVIPMAAVSHQKISSVYVINSATGPCLDDRRLPCAGICYGRRWRDITQSVAILIIRSETATTGNSCPLTVCSRGPPGRCGLPWRRDIVLRKNCLGEILRPSDGRVDAVHVGTERDLVKCWGMPLPRRPVGPGLRGCVIEPGERKLLEDFRISHVSDITFPDFNLCVVKWPSRSITRRRSSCIAGGILSWNHVEKKRCPFSGRKL